MYTSSKPLEISLSYHHICIAKKVEYNQELEDESTYHQYMEFPRIKLTKGVLLASPRFSPYFSFLFLWIFTLFFLFLLPYFAAAEDAIRGGGKSRTSKNKRSQDQAFGII